jgi:hypothetical protein
MADKLPPPDPTTPTDNQNRRSEPFQPPLGGFLLRALCAGGHPSTRDLARAWHGYGAAVLVRRHLLVDQVASGKVSGRPRGANAGVAARRRGGEVGHAARGRRLAVRRAVGRRCGRRAAAAGGRRRCGGDKRRSGGRQAPVRRVAAARRTGAAMNSVVWRVAVPREPRIATSLSPANSSARRPALRVAISPLDHPRSGSGAAPRPFGRWAAGGGSAAQRTTRQAA